MQRTSFAICDAPLAFVVYYLNLIPRRFAMPARPVGYPDVQQKSRNPEWKDAVKSVRNRMGFAIDEQKNMHAKRKCEQSQYPTGD
jgi:hypothetical protein